MYNKGMEEKIKVLYTCGVCPIVDRSVDVPVRKPEQDVAEWMDQTVKLLATDHRTQAPRCQATAFKMVKIPTDGRENVGGPLVN